MTVVCTICQDLLTERPANSDQLLILGLKCGHIFHQTCISSWFSRDSGGAQGSCPCCKTEAHLSEALRLYPSGDEDAGTAPSKLEELAMTRGEVSQLNGILEEMGCQLENERVEHEILKYEHSQSLSELEALKSSTEKLKESLNFLSAERDALARDKEELSKRVTELELTLASGSKDCQKMRMMEEAHLQEIRRYEKLLNKNVPTTASVSVQTEKVPRDAELLQARLVSYKSCMLHMQAEVRALEDEYARLTVSEGSGEPAAKSGVEVNFNFGSGLNSTRTPPADNSEKDLHLSKIMAMSVCDIEGDGDAEFTSGDFSDAPLWAADALDGGNDI